MAAETKSAPILPWKTRLLVARLSFACDYTRRSNGTVNRLLMNFLDAKSPPSDKPMNGVTSSDITVDASRNLWFRLFTPVDADKLPVIVYFHGGGFVFFSASTKPYDEFCRRLAKNIPAVVVSVNYRLAPEHRFPAQFDDAFDALKFLDAKFLPPNADVSRCFIAGDSAGGNIAHQVALRSAAADAEGGFRRLRIAGVIAIQPFFGGEERTESELKLTHMPILNMELSDWMWKAFLPEGSNRNHEGVNFLSDPKSAHISGLNFPATMVFVGGFDPLQDLQRKYYDWLKKSGKEAYLVEYPQAIHAFYVFPELPEASQLINDVRDFIQKQCQ
ncbi:Carboxylesterase [Actinidia chinensis var. chinensis]|uniref:Carboxylesterase n=1 Tax=Actinidia chinensis var. chinensis TaxID=1590841 RepID=A0A2R6R285_ACTCC|nr:Carboxylesterase [Actinidia chinensis var. chinensis]